MKCCGFIFFAGLTRFADASQLLIAENGGHGENPPPMGDLISVDTQTLAKTVIAKDMQDPVWVAAQDGFAYVGLFHAGTVVQVHLGTGAQKTVATGLSCPEGVGLGQDGYLYAVENPIGNECRQDIRKAAAQLTRINMTSGEQTKIAPLKSPHGMDIDGNTAYVCECGERQVTRVDLVSGTKVRVAGMNDNSGCAVGGGYVYAIEEGSRGELVKISVKSGETSTLISGLRGPMGVAVDVSEGFVYAGERSSNQVRRVAISGGDSEVFISSLNSNIGMTIVPSSSALV